jgi:hypothetical protein
MSLGERLRSAATLIRSFSVANEIASVFVELSSLEQVLDVSLVSISAQEFKSYAADWLVVVEGCCKSTDSLIVAQGWRLLLQLCGCRRLCGNLMTIMPTDFQTCFGSLLRGGLSDPAECRIHQVTELLLALTRQAQFGEVDVASKLLLADDSALLQLVVNRVSLLWDSELKLSSKGLSMMRLLVHVGGGESIPFASDELSMGRAGHAARALVDIVNDECADEGAIETILLAAGALSIFAAFSEDAEPFDAAATVFHGLLLHIKCGRFACRENRLKCLQTICIIAYVLLRNDSAPIDVRDRVALLGIPSSEVSTVDVALLWWFLQHDRQSLGASYRHADHVHEQLITCCCRYGLIERLAHISSLDSHQCSDVIRCHSAALLIHIARLSEETFDRCLRSMPCLSDIGMWCTADLCKEVSSRGTALVYSMEELQTRIDVRGCTDRPSTIVWMALNVWLPCDDKMTPMWLAGRAFDAVSVALKRMLNCRSFPSGQDVTLYSNYLMQWYISTGWKLVRGTNFFHLARDLVFYQSNFHGSAIFLQAATMELEKCNLARYSAPPEYVLQMSLHCLKGMTCRGSSSDIIAQFFVSFLCGHHARTCGAGGASLPSCDSAAWQLLSEVARILGDDCASDIWKLLGSKTPEDRICQIIQTKMQRDTSSRGGA